MSALSTITSSLPNVLNLLHGSWSVSYRARIPLSLDEKENKLAELEGNDLSTATKLLAFADVASSFFDDGWNVIDFDSFIDLQEIVDTSITDNPVEQGSFRSVNKVKKPKQIKVTLAKGGIGFGIEATLSTIKPLVLASRIGVKKVSASPVSTVISTCSAIINEDTTGIKNNLKKLEEMAKEDSMPLIFRVITPFDMITNLNLIKFDYTFKKDSGTNMLIMYLTFEEIMSVEMEVKSLKVGTPTNAGNTIIGRLSGQKGG